MSAGRQFSLLESIGPVRNLIRVDWTLPTRRHEVYFGPPLRRYSPVRNLLPERSFPRHERDAFGTRGAPRREQGAFGAKGVVMAPMAIP